MGVSSVYIFIFYPKRNTE